MRKTKLGLLIFGLHFFITIRLFIYFFVLIYGFNLTSLSVVHFWLVILADILNLVLIWLVGKKILGENCGFLAFLFYAISPWPAYLAVGGSEFVFVLFGILLFYFGLTLIRDRRMPLGVSLGLLGLAVAALSLFQNTSSFREVLTKNVSLFNEVGLINSINTFRGEINETGHPYLGILIENKITYLGRHVLFNTLAVFSPFTYFTPQFKLLGFSFTPPIFLGLLIPFLYGFTRLINGGNKRDYLLLLTLPLLIPTILRAYSPDLNSLILILPAIIFVSAWGMGELIRTKKWFFVATVLMLIFIQGLTTLYDIKTREPIRYFKTVQIYQ